MRSHILSGLLLSMSAAALVACSGGQPKGLEPTKTAVPMPPETLLESTLTESDTLTPVTAGGTTGVTTTTTTSALSAPPVTVPASPVAVEDRIAKLEETVGSLRRDYDRIMPAFASLNTTNERIQTLLDEIEVQTPGVAMGKTQSQVIAPTTVEKTVETKMEVAAAPSPEVIAAMDRMSAPAANTVIETTTTTTTTKAPVASATTAAITETAKNVRIGEHGSKTRIVVDLGGNMKPDAKFDLDNSEKLLLVDLPGTAWVGAPSGAPKNSAFVSGWSVQDGSAGGSALAIQLKKGAKILSTEYLKASGKDGARLVIDIGPSV